MQLLQKLSKTLLSKANILLFEDSLSITIWICMAGY